MHASEAELWEIWYEGLPSGGGRKALRNWEDRYEKPFRARSGPFKTYQAHRCWLLAYTKSWSESNVKVSELVLMPILRKPPWTEGSGHAQCHVCRKFMCERWWIEESFLGIARLMWVLELDCFNSFRNDSFCSRGNMQQLRWNSQRENTLRDLTGMRILGRDVLEDSASWIESETPPYFRVLSCEQAEWHSIVWLSS